MDYRLEIDLEVVRFLLSLRQIDGDFLVQQMDFLRQRPFSLGHSSIADDTGRDIQVSKVRNFLIYHWTDHPVKTVRIDKIEISKY